MYLCTLKGFDGKPGQNEAKTRAKPCRIGFPETNGDWRVHTSAGSHAPRILRGDSIMLSRSVSAAVRLPPASESDISAGVFTNRKLPEPEWEKPLACRADEGPIKEIEWLWPGRIPIGKVTLLTGPAGAGKSLVALDLAARVSRGEELPRSEEDRFPHNGVDSRGSVLVVVPMHEAEDVVRPRLRDFKADMSKVHLLFGGHDQAGDRLVALPHDLSSVEHFLEVLDFPKLVVIDGLEELCPNRRQEENTMRELTLLAVKHKVAILVVARSNPRRNKQGEYQPPTNQVLGHAPVVWSLIPDEDEKYRSHLISTRFNFRRPARGLTIQITETGTLQWGELDHQPEIVPDLPVLEDWLTHILGNGAMQTTEVEALGLKFGFSKGMIYRAGKKLGYEKEHRGFGGLGKWYWVRPEPPSPPAKPAEPENLDPAVLAETAWLDQPVRRPRPADTRENGSPGAQPPPAPELVAERGTAVEPSSNGVPAAAEGVTETSPAAGEERIESAIGEMDGT